MTEPPEPPDCEHTAAVRLLPARFLLEAYCTRCGVSLATLTRQAYRHHPDTLERWCSAYEIDLDLARAALSR